MVRRNTKRSDEALLRMLEANADPFKTQKLQVIEEPLPGIPKVAFWTRMWEYITCA